MNENQFLSARPMIRRSANDSDYLQSRPREHLDDKNDNQNDKDDDENKDDDDDDDDAIQEDETENDMGDDNKHENNDKNDNDVRNDDSVNGNTSSFSIADMIRERDNDFSRLSSRLAVNSTPRAQTRLESLPAASTIHRPVPLIAANLSANLRSHLLISEPIVEGARQAAVAPERAVESGLLGESRTAAHASSISFDSSRYYDDDGKPDIAPRRNLANNVAEGDDDDNQNSNDDQRVPLRRERRAPHATSLNTFSSSRISLRASETARVHHDSSRIARPPRPSRLSSEQRQQQQREQRQQPRQQRQQSLSPNRQNPSFSNNSANSNRPRPSFSSNSSDNTTWADILGGERVRRFESDPRFANVRHEHTLPQIQVAQFHNFSFGESISFPHQQCVYNAVRQRNEYGGFVSTQIAGALASANINLFHPLLEANDYTQTRVAILRENQLRHGVKGLNFHASEQDGEEQDEWEEEEDG